MPTLVGPSKKDSLKSAVKHQLVFRNSHCRDQKPFKLQSKSLVLTRHGEELEQEFDALMDELVIALRTIPGNDLCAANQAFSGLLAEDRYLSIRTILTNLGRAFDYAWAADRFLELREFWRLHQNHPMRPAILRMVRGECRTISDSLTNWLIQNQGFNFHTADACPDHVDPNNKPVIEHCIPLNLLHNRLMGMKTVCCQEGDPELGNSAEIQDFLERHIIVALITKGEEKKVRPKNAMPTPVAGNTRWRWRLLGDDTSARERDMGRYIDIGVPFFERCWRCN